MAKKFGKFLLFTAAAGAAAAAVYCYMQKKDAENAVSADSDDDYDDFSRETTQKEEDTSRTYVSLNLDNVAGENSSDKANTGDEAFTPLSEQAARQNSTAAADAVEEFFDEDEDSAADSPIQQN